MLAIVPVPIRKNTRRACVTFPRHHPWIHTRTYFPVQRYRDGISPIIVYLVDGYIAENYGAYMDIGEILGTERTSNSADTGD